MTVSPTAIVQHEPSELDLVDVLRAPPSAHGLADSTVVAHPCARRPPASPSLAFSTVSRASSVRASAAAMHRQGITHPVHGRVRRVESLLSDGVVYMVPMKDSGRSTKGSERSTKGSERQWKVNERQ